LESIASQTYSGWEVIIVDSPSPISVHVKRLADSIPRAQYLVDSGANGVYPAMNRGVAMSRGSWILFLGHDDSLHDPAVLERVKHHIDLRKLLYWRQAYYGSVLINGDAGWAKDGEIYAGQFDLSQLLRRNICHQAIFYRGLYARSNRCGYLNAYPVTADWDYNIRAWTCGGFGYLPILISIFCGGGISSSMHHDDFAGKNALTLAYWMKRRPLVLALITLLYCRLVASGWTRPPFCQ
jgi:glycosyltransferase involved in cell wall biosynthesis